MAEYFELLQREEWKSKRKEILIRDQNKCTICSNYNLLNKYRISYCVLGTYPSGKAIIVVYDKDKKQTIRCRTNYQKESFQKLYQPHSEKSIICLTTGEDAFCSLAGLIIANEELDYSTIGNITTENIKEYSAKQQLIQESYLQNLTMENFKLLKWVDLMHLHIHHKYYCLNKMPWEYPNEALQTLCWQCHEDLHKNETVPVYNEYHQYMNDCNPCPRCFGAGYIPIYSHVQAGICFKCNGKRYIES